MTARIAIDTGGTFTDFALLEDGRLRVHKVRSTPDDPSRAILTGIAELLGGSSAEVIHGSTVATNALLEHKGARVAFLITAGFEDVLAIGRQTRSELYKLVNQPRRPLAGDGEVIGVQERVAAGGEIIQCLSVDEIARIVAVVRQLRPESIAICLLHSYSNPAHEQRLASVLRAEGYAVSASHEILAEYREFERASTTVVNAYVSPIMSRYLTMLRNRLNGGSLQIMQSSGGFIAAEVAGREAVRTVLSGPAGGAVGALSVAAAAGYSRVITFDMGGTSTDVSLLDGALPMTAESAIGDFPIRTPSIDIHTIGAGGGSIAYIDAGGALRVGPRSAGAFPGPACYGSGEELTVTDANLLLGRLDAESFFGGRIKLDVERARSIAAKMAGELGFSVEALAAGIVRIANSHMERALRVVSVQRGYDPRDFALLAFGGAGPMHACDLAGSLDIKTVLVPEHAGVLSALGMLFADYSKSSSRSVLQCDLSYGQLEALFANMSNTENSQIERSVDVRYAGQSFELNVPFSPGYRRQFDALHEKRFGYKNENRSCEVVTLRMKEMRPTPKPVIRASRSISGHGPRVMTGAQATTVVPAGWSFHTDSSGMLILKRDRA